MNGDGVHSDVGFEMNIPAMAAIYSVGVTSILFPNIRLSSR